MIEDIPERMTAHSAYNILENVLRWTVNEKLKTQESIWMEKANDRTQERLKILENIRSNVIQARNNLNNLEERRENE